MTDSAREKRVRRLARRQDLVLSKSRRRNPDAIDYGTYQLIDQRTNGLVFGGQWGADLDEVEDHLTGGGAS